MALITTTTTTMNAKLSRSASMERIKKLNTYICAQNYFILPALLAWLRAPHDKLRAKLERFIAVLKFVLFSSFLPRLAFRLGVASARMAGASLKDLASADVLSNARVIRIAVYSALATVCLQLVVCLYYLAGVMQSGGFVFMVSCLYLITQMNVSCLHFFLREEKVLNLVGGRPAQVVKRLSRKDILGKRTISNMNLI